MEIDKNDKEYISKKKIEFEYFTTFINNMKKILKICLDGNYSKIDIALKKYPLDSKIIIELNDFNLYCLTSKYFSKEIKKYIFEGKSIFKYDNDSLKLIESKLNKNGIHVHNEYLNDDLIKKIINACNGLEFSNMKNNKFDNKIKIDDVTKCEIGRFMVYNQGDILSIPEVQEIVTDPFILKVCQNYLQANPILVQTNFWVTNGHEKGFKDNTHEFHQDNDDLKFIKVFIYLNDVDENNGPHSYVKGSINNLKLPDVYRISQRLPDDYIKKNYGDNVLTLTGRRGTMIFENTYGFHKGCPIKKGYRLMLQLQFASSTSFFISRYLRPIRIASDEKTKKYIEFKKRYPVCGIFFYS